MAINTQSDLITHLRFLSGDSTNTLTEAEAVRLLNFALDHYTYLALTSDGKWQVDDIEQSDVPIATATLSSGAFELPLNENFLSINYIEIQNSDGDRFQLEQFDRAQNDRATIKTTDTGMPTEYDYNNGVLTFNYYADADYTVRVFYTRPFTHFSAGNSTQVTGIPTIHTEYLVLNALHKLALRTGNEHRTQLRQEIERMERDIRDFYGKRDEDTPVQVSPLLDVRT